MYTYVLFVDVMAADVVVIYTVLVWNYVGRDIQNLLMHHAHHYSISPPLVTAPAESCHHR